MIHLIVRAPLPYQQTLCRTLSDSYGGAFVAWFEERKDAQFPYRSRGEPSFVHHYLSETGYRTLFESLKADPEAVVILGGWSAPMTNKTLLITTLLRIPVFVWADHPHPRQRHWLFEHARILYIRLLAHLVSGFLACGKPTVEYLAALGIKRNMITNFPYWVELPPEWSVPKRCLDDVTAGRPLRLLAIGRQVPVKQFQIAIDAVALANARAAKPLAELVLVGDGPERTNLESRSLSVAKLANIHFMGWLEMDETLETLRGADALVLTSRFDAFGVVVLEALSTGRPVLASAGVMAARDRNEGTGAILIHAIGDVGALAEQIALFATDNRSLQSASIAARANAEKWAPHRAGAILDQVLGRTRRGKRLMKHRQVAGIDWMSTGICEGLNHEPIEQTRIVTEGQ